LEFFDDKEEVIEIQLTQHGKRALAEGRFRPVYYSFSDSDLLYDTLYAGLTASQNSHETRIFDETPRLKPLYNFSGVETEFCRLKKLYSYKQKNTYENIYLPFDQTEADRTYSSNETLGTSDLNSEYAPAWSIRLLASSISSSADILSGAAPNVRIPQLTILDPKYHINVITGVPQSIKDAVRGLGVADEGIRNFEFSDGSIVEVQEDQIILELEELNSPFTNENFEIEVFLVDEELTKNTTYSSPTGFVTSSREILTPLYFKGIERVRNNLYVEEDFNEIEIEVDPTMVEYFIKIETDQEVDPRTLCKVIPKEKRRGIYGSRIVDCEQEVLVSVKDIYDSVKDIYDTDVEDVDDIEEPC
jgi:hypothetical protein